MWKRRGSRAEIQHQDPRLLELASEICYDTGVAWLVDFDVSLAEQVPEDLVFDYSTCVWREHNERLVQLSLVLLHFGRVNDRTTRKEMKSVARIERSP